MYKHVILNTPPWFNLNLTIHLDKEINISKQHIHYMNTAQSIMSDKNKDKNIQ